MHCWHIGGLQRIGQQAYIDTGIGPAGQVAQARLLRDEIGRDHDQLLADAIELRPQLRAHQQRPVRFVVGQHLARCIPQCLAMGPDQLFAPDAELRPSTVGHEVVVQSLVLSTCGLQ
ncbi:hypothetical protein D9M71_266880 [compost metagenome]